MTTSTRTVLKEGILNLLNPLFAPKLGGLVMPLTASGGSSTTAVIDLLARGSNDTDDFNDCQIENITQSEVGGITDGGFSTATLTFSPTASTGFSASDVGHIYGPGLTPEMFDSGINRVLLGTEALFAYLPTMINADAADFTGTVESEWIDIAGGTPTQTYDTSDGFVLTGERSLKIVTTAANEDVKSRDIAVTGGENLILSVFVACPTGSMRVQLYDETNSAVIETSGTYDNPDFNEIRLDSITVPDTCELVTVRFLNETDASTFYVAQNPALQSQDGRIYRLPSWIEHEGQVFGSIELPTRDAGEANDTWLAHAAHYISGPKLEFITSERSLTAVSLKFRAISNPVALLVYRAFEALSSNTASTTCDRDYLIYKVAARICRLQDDDNWRRFARIAHNRAGIKEYGPQKTAWVDNAKVALGPQTTFPRS